ncbi:hypothetical protein QFZ24_000231 [Streptomyces phaeochromogenes]|nr:hypothetical protein [Streptomyces phaeochromogenes]
MKDAPLFLRPRVEPPLASLLGDAPFLHSLVDALGSPLNVLLPEVVAETRNASAPTRRQQTTARRASRHGCGRE